MFTYALQTCRLLNLASRTRDVDVTKQLEWEAQSASFKPPQPSTKKDSSLEPFPEYSELNYEGALFTHCVKHCQQIVCSHVYRRSERPLPPPECICETQTVVATKPLDTVSKWSIEKMTIEDLQDARQALKSRDKDETINICYASTKALLRHLRAAGVIDLQVYLLRSEDFRKLRLKEGLTHTAAAKDASKLIKNIFTYFHLSFKDAPNERKVVTIKQLELELMACLRWDVLAFLCQWVWKGRKLRRTGWSSLKDAIEKNKGVHALWEEAEICVQDVIAVCVWWDEQRGWKEKRDICSD